MEAGIDFYKKLIGKIKKITEKRAKLNEFFTPPCLVMTIPKGAVYYEIILEKGSVLENRYGSRDSKIIENERELLFFEFSNSKNLKVGKNMFFFIAGSRWISNWQEAIE